MKSLSLLCLPSCFRSSETLATKSRLHRIVVIIVLEIVHISDCIDYSTSANYHAFLLNSKVQFRSKMTDQPNKVTTDQILTAANWQRESTFNSFYRRKLERDD